MPDLSHQAPPRAGQASSLSSVAAADDRTYSISELSEIFSVTPRAIRFYESKGLLSPARNGMTRIYSKRDRVRLELILRGKRVGLSLSEIKEILDLYDLEDGHRAQLKHAQAKFRERIDILQAQRADIDLAITELERGIATVEQILQTKYEDQGRDEEPAGALAQSAGR